MFLQKKITVVTHYNNAMELDVVSRDLQSVGGQFDDNCSRVILESFVTEFQNWISESLALICEVVLPPPSHKDAKKVAFVNCDLPENPEVGVRRISTLSRRDCFLVHNQQKGQIGIQQRSLYLHVPPPHPEDAAALPHVQHEVPLPQQDTVAGASAVGAQTKQDTVAASDGAQTEQVTAKASVVGAQTEQAYMYRHWVGMFGDVETPPDDQKWSMLTQTWGDKGVLVWANGLKGPGYWPWHEVDTMSVLETKMEI
ncbi:hypothetical protein LWI29_037301 [Acer saccharum]|uniref:Uncharacterized protein n=1 Tax=Acer saccharum TaxID=4024 RepID=A0AA39SLH8_ACESA|nr:hypothetical protein LWI29_037301 [Acer saccharum]